VNGNDATLATAPTGSRVHGHAPSAPVGGVFGLILAAAVGSALGRSGAPYALTILRQASAAANGWKPQRHRLS
jgi:hypothetical protein